MRIFLLKLGLFALLVFGLQCLVPPSKDIPNEIKLLDVFMKNKADIVYFGDSTINWAAKSDINQESMPGLLQRLLPASRVAKITHSSYQPAVYEAFAEYMVRKGYHPRFVIIPINLRIFSPEWDRQPLWQFEKEKLTLAMKDTFGMRFYRPLAVFKFFDPRINRFDYEQTGVYDGGQLIGKVEDFDNETYQSISDDKMRNKLTFRYMYPISVDHRKIKSIVHTAEVLKGAGIEPIFYITPVDWQTLERSLGPRSVARIADNVALINSVLEKQGIVPLDLSRSLPTSEFSWPEDGDGPFYPNEHLRLHGRMFVVGSLLARTALHEK